MPGITAEQVERDVKALVGGGYSAADRISQALATWTPPLTEIDQEAIPNWPLIEARAQDMARNDGYVQNAISLHQNSGVGAFFRLNATPDVRALGIDDPVWEQEFQEEGVEELILFPMYPHYSTTTTLSSVEDVEARCEAMEYRPKIRVVEPYYDDYDYLSIQAELIARAAEGIDTREYDLILSAHGLPMSIIRAGDPYEKQVEANVSALKIVLRERGVIFKNIKLAYQSKVGNAAWLEPNLADVLRKPKNLKVIIFPLAFTIDNSETIFELDREHREIAEKIGYEDYRVARCPNDSEAFARFIGEKIAATA